MDHKRGKIMLVNHDEEAQDYEDESGESPAG
jgi:hypothetical protein